MIKIENLHKSYGKLKVLNGIDMEVNNGEVVCLIGASGSGKSTLLLCVNALEIIDNGKVRFSTSPCPKKYCIHQGWINKANQTIVCIPNQISISIVGAKRKYDSINY